MVTALPSWLIQAADALRRLADRPWTLFLLLLAANALWAVGRGVSWSREVVGHKVPHTCEREWLDNWTDAFKPPS